MVEASEWRRCSSCKKPIGFAVTYFECSVSTCTRKRTGYAFCSVDCWEIHLPMMRHREAWAVEATSPTREAWAQELAQDDGARTGTASSSGAGKPVAAPAPAAAPVVRRSDGEGGRRIAVPSAPATPPAPREVLVIASRLKEYIRQRYGMNTSDGVLEDLSDHLRRLCDRAVLHAREDGRKTVLDRDFAFLSESK
ncbi:MAG: hypothetical protein JNK45_23635 [Myxococcales bacterium]|nr:hypothetical protein [Myxococcales bacterium]